MDDSILDTIKKLLGIPIENSAFDLDVIVHINGTFMTLHQLGVSDDPDFHVVDSGATWSDYLLDRNLLNSVRTILYLHVRLIFDPPTNSFAIQAFERQIKELEWRITVLMDEIRIAQSITV